MLRLPAYRSGDGQLEFGGWIWRYDLAPFGPSETEVTLTYDWSAVPLPNQEYLEFPPFGPEYLTSSNPAPGRSPPALCRNTAEYPGQGD